MAHLKVWRWVRKSRHATTDQDPWRQLTTVVVLNNLSANTTPAIRAWTAAHKVELCLTPTNAS